MAYNGHAIDGILMPETGTLPTTQKYAIRGNTLESDHAIVNCGLILAIDINEFLCVDSK